MSFTERNELEVVLVPDSDEEIVEPSGRDQLPFGLKGSYGSLERTLKTLKSITYLQFSINST